ncbi:MAG: serine protein kinase RIO [Candidatus Altiarchaeota archaeon]|nr:serine protein kinase RIO [Candidatus Altiarchaeota archaeon]
MDADRFLGMLDRRELKSEKQRAHSRKVCQSVFDRVSLTSLYHLTKKGFFRELKSVVSEGKEAKVFHGVGNHGDVAVKIYMVETSDFRSMSSYVKGDPRFGGWANRRQLVNLWAQKEYKNLMRVCEKISCPKPLGFHKNVLVMEFIGEEGLPAPKMKDVELENPKEYCEKLISYMREMYKVRLVHSDLSEYNVLDYRGEPYIIDFSTGILLDHPKASEFLERDIGNIVGFFSKKGVEVDYSRVYKEVTDGV